MLNLIPSLKNLAHLFSTHPLTRDAPLKAWARFASWQVRSRIQEDVMIPWVGGQRLIVRRGMTGATGNIYVGLHEFEDMMFPLHFLREGDLFLDIGANVGSYTVLASGVCRAMTWAFEPDPDTVRHLARNVAINNLDSLVTIHECALGDTEGTIPFTVGLDTVNKVATARENNVRLVRQERLDALIGGAQPVMIKMDVEGYEEWVIRGAANLLTNKCLKIIELETVTIGINEILVSNQFELAHYEPFSRKLERGSLGVSSTNSLFVRDWGFVDSRLKRAGRIEVLDHSI